MTAPAHAAHPGGRPPNRRRCLRPIVIVGGGVAGVSAAKTLRRQGYDGPLVLVSAECSLPYRLAPLSKGFLRGEIGRAELLIEPPAFYRTADIDVLLGARATGLDRGRRRLAVRGHGMLRYEHLIVATGSGRTGGAEPGGAHRLRNLADAVSLRDAAARASRVVVVGMGLTGAEVAASLRSLGLEVIVLEQAPIAFRSLGEAVGRWVAARHRRQNVRLLLGVGAARLESTGAATRVVTATGLSVEADLVVLTTGTRQATGLDRLLGTPAHAARAIGSDATGSRIVVAGNAVAFNDHEAAARAAGARAARAVLGLRAAAPEVPDFTTEQFGSVLRVVGTPTWADETVEIACADARAMWIHLAAGKIVAAAGVDRGEELDAYREHIRARLHGGDVSTARTGVSLRGLEGSP